MLIGLTGYAQSGKDTVANLLVENYGYTRIAFADPIRELLYRLNPETMSAAGSLRLQSLVDDYGWDVAKQVPEVRRLLQELGVGARKIIDESVWVTTALRAHAGDKVVFTDVRFENEAVIIKLMGGQIWRVKRLGVSAVNDHISESELDGYKVDQIFVNNGSVDDLKMLLDTRMRAYV